MRADLVPEGARGRVGVDGQLGSERIDADLILAQRQVSLALAAEAAHQATVGVLPARVTLDDHLAEGGAGPVPTLGEV